MKRDGTTTGTAGGSLRAQLFSSVREQFRVSILISHLKPKKTSEKVLPFKNITTPYAIIIITKVTWTREWNGTW